MLFNAELEFARGELSDLLMRVSRRSLPLQMLKDAIVSYGEQLSSRLLAEVLKAKGVNARQIDSRRLIVTDDEYGAAQPIWDETNELVQLELRPLIEAGEVPVMGGFIAGNRGGETTTLGTRRLGLFGGVGRGRARCARAADLDRRDRRDDLRPANLRRRADDPGSFV